MTSFVDKVSARFDDLLRLSKRLGILAPPHTFDTKPKKLSLSEVRSAWNGYETVSKREKRTALYLHVPFCSRRCSFCMYDSMVSNRKDVDRYVMRLVDEFQFWHNELTAPLESFYIGGGTPSILSTHNIETLFGKLDSLTFKENSSRTFEMSPSTISDEKLQLLSSTFINRISIGVQSIDSGVLKAINRHNPPIASIKRYIGNARNLNFKDVNIDMMVGLNGQNVGNVVDGLRQVVDMSPLSITIYSFRDTRNTSIYSESERHEKIRMQLQASFEFLESNGWQHASGTIDTEYNVFFSPQKSSCLIRHKTSIDGFNNMHLIGLGSGAIGFNPSIAYEADPAVSDFDILSPKYLTYVHSRLQQLQLAVCNMMYSHSMQIDTVFFEDNFGVSFESVFGQEIEELSSIGRLVYADHKYKFIYDSEYEAAAIQKFFWDKEFLQQNFN